MSISYTANSPGESENLTINNDLFIGANQTLRYANMVLIINGNITINATGKLILDNVDLFLNNTEFRSINIYVKALGSLKVLGSRIRANSVETCSSIIFYKNSTGNLINSTFKTLGMGNSDATGIQIYSNNVELSNCTIQYSNTGLNMMNCSIDISDLFVRDSDVAISGKNTKSKLSKISIIECEMDIKLSGASNITIIDSNIESSELDSISKIYFKRELSIQLIFNTPHFKPIKNGDVQVINNDFVIYSTPGFGGSDDETDLEGRIIKLFPIDKLYIGEMKYNYTTTISGKYKSRIKNNQSVDFAQPNSGTQLISFSNKQPTLQEAVVIPNSGLPNTQFCFKIKYSDFDGDEPNSIQMEIDGVKYNLTKPTDLNSDDWKNGVWCQYYLTNLSIGQHKFKFSTNNGFGFSDVTDPSEEASMKYHPGPNVYKPNSDPILDDGYVTPNIGDPDTIFIYRIRYYDTDGDETKHAKVYIDDIPHSMTPVSDLDENNDSVFETWFEYETKLNLGNHEFYFKFKDDNGSAAVCWPTESEEQSVIDGPVVNQIENQPPILGNGSVSPSVGHRLYLYSYTISYYDFEGDEPTIAIVVIDGVPFNLTRAKIAQNIYFYETYEPLGEHLFHFEFWNEDYQQFVRYPADLGTEILGPIVLDMPPQLDSGQVEPAIGTPGTIFKFSIWYSDIENDLPETAEVIIDNQTFEMKIESTGVDVNNQKMDDSNGIVLTYQTTLSLGDHSYYFIIKTNDFTLTYPSSKSLMGPSVVEKDANDTDIDDLDNGSQNNSDDNDNGNGNDDEVGGDNTSKDLVDNNNKSTILDKSENSTAEVEYLILDSILQITEDSNGFRYTFIFICQVNCDMMPACQGLVNIDGQEHIMSVQQIAHDNVFNFSVSLYLTPDEHYYHFKIDSDSDAGARLPFKGEFMIPRQGDQNKEDEMIRDSEDKLSNDFRFEIIQVLFVILIILAVIFFSFYRKLNLLQRGKN
jgi:hypothetical protein